MRNKEIPYVFPGPFKAYFMEYVDYKRSLGFKVGASVYYGLRDMAAFFLRYDLTYDRLILTKEMVEAYVSIRVPESIKTQHMRMSMVRQFAMFMNRIGFVFYVYPESDFVHVKAEFIPYIFTYREIEILTIVLDTLPASTRYPTYHLVYPMLFRMLIGCGLRINEALGLKMTNIDMVQGIIKLDNTKNSMQRLLPMSQSLHGYCKSYIKHMRFSPSYDGYFYPTKSGGEYNSTPVYCQFRKFMQTARIFRENGTTPRVHDMRHTFAVHSLEKMVSEGRDVYCALPILCMYLGHRDIESTEKYLRMTAEAYNSVLGSMEVFYRDMFPEVNGNEE